MGLAAESADVYTLPAATGLPIEQLARVIAVPGPKNVASKFVALFDDKRHEIRVRKFPVVSVTGTELRLPPAKYAFTVSCARPLGDFNYVPFSMTLAVGHTYSIWCEPIPWSVPIVRFKDQSHAEWDGSAVQPEAAADSKPKS